MSAVPAIGRSTESEVVESFFDGLAGGSRCLLLEGEVGIGKTTLLNWARTAAIERGYLVLSANPVEQEFPREFAALSSLLETVPAEVFSDLPGPQRRAIGVAVAGVDPSDAPVDARTLATAVLSIVRRLAIEAPVVLAIDDLPWLDLPSSRALSFVLRRSGAAAVGLLGAVRTEWTQPRYGAPLVSDSVDPSRVERLTLGPISFREMRDLLAERTSLKIRRSTLARLHEVSRGNPMFVLELVADNASVWERGLDGSLGVPTSLRRLVRERVKPLPAAARELLLIGALSGEPSLEVALAAADDRERARESLEQLADAGLVRRHGDGDAIVFAHPLIRSVVAGEATAAQRRAGHRRLASTARRREVRSRHLGLGAEGADEGVALEVEAAAESAAARGACETAAELADLAVSVTPTDRIEERHRRMAFEADSRFQASDPARACELLDAVVSEMPAGSPRAELLRRLARYSAHRGDPFSLWIARLTSALDEAGDDLALRTAITFDLATALANAGDRETAGQYGSVVLALAEQAGDPALLAQICAALAFNAFALGGGVDQDLVERGLSGPEQPLHLNMEMRPRVVIGHILRWSDDLDGARSLLEVEYERASEEGVETGLPLLLCGLAEAEAWAGNWERAEELSAEGCELADDAGSAPGIALMYGMQGLIHVYRGRIEEGVSDAQRALTTALSIGFPPAVLFAAQALGLAGLSVGDAAAAHERLAPIADFVRTTGVAEPGLVHFLPDEIEALIRLGELEAAEELLGPLESRSAELGRTWGIAASGRCRGLLLAAAGEYEAAGVALEGALELHRQLTMPFEHGRTLLVAGEIWLRAEGRSASGRGRDSDRDRDSGSERGRDYLETAGAIFAKLGAPLWEQRVRDAAAQ